METENRIFFSPKTAFIAFTVLIISNVLILDFIFLKDFNSKETVITAEKSSKSDIGKQNNESKNQGLDQSCPVDCLAKIYEATSSLKLQSTPTGVNTSTGTTSESTYSSVKEFFVPLGSGSNATDDWADVSGLQAYIDSTGYGRTKSIVFEAAVHIPTGNEKAYVRLFNMTDQHPVWFSEVSLEGGTPQLLISKPISLDQGSKLYKVQMKTTLKYQAVLDQARVHITTY